LLVALSTRSIDAQGGFADDWAGDENVMCKQEIKKASKQAMRLTGQKVQSVHAIMLCDVELCRTHTHRSSSTILLLHTSSF
jgi:hypothetical protein